MKLNLHKTAAVIMIISCTAIHVSYAQFQTVATPPTNYLRTNAITRGVGIGNFTAPPASALSINTNLFPSGFQIGETFRTDCPIGQTTSWRLFRGGTQYGRFFNLTGSNHFQFQSFSGDMLFRTGSAGGNGRAHMRIFDATGFLGIGPNLADAFTARSEVHIHDTTTTYLQFTNTTTQTMPDDPQSTDGFIVGINSTGGSPIAELRQQEDAPIDIFTTNSKRAFFSTAGFFTNNNTSATGYGLRVSTL